MSMSEHEKDNMHLEISREVSKNKKKISEIMKRLMEERKIKIENCDIQEWHRLILDAEAILFAEKKMI